MTRSKCELKKTTAMLEIGASLAGKLTEVAEGKGTCFTGAEFFPRVHLASKAALTEMDVQASGVYDADGCRGLLDEKKRRILAVAAELDPLTARLIEPYDRGDVPKRDNSIAAPVRDGYQRGNFQFWDKSRVTPGNWTYLVTTDFPAHGHTQSALVTEEHRGFDVSLAEGADEPPATEPSSLELGSAPPTSARYLLALVLSTNDRHAILGDLIEEYRTYIGPEFGERLAKLWFWAQTLRSIYPIVSRRLVKLASGIGVVKAVTSIWKRFVA